MTPLRAPASALPRALGCALVASAAACTSPASEPLGFGAVYEAPAAADGGAPAAFHAVRGSGPGDGWAVGEGGMAVAFAGGTWTPVDSGTTATLGGLDTLDVYHAFAVERGGARVLAWNGRAWSPLGADRADRAAAAAFAAGANDVWVVGDGIEHWDGTTWTQQVPGGAGAASTFTAISGSFRTDLWAVGPAGAWHFNGSAWAAVSLPAGAPPLAAVWTATLADTWIAGAQGTVLVWNGSSLTLVQTGTTKDLTAISGTGPTDVWAGGVDGAVVHWDGTSWAVSVTPAASTINDLWSDFPGDLFFVDGTGAVTHDAL